MHRFKGPCRGRTGAFHGRANPHSTHRKDRAPYLAELLAAVPPEKAVYSATTDGLLVETAQLLNAANDEQDYDKWVELLTIVKQNLKRVIELYPSSDAAVKLATGQAIGNLSPADVSALVAEALQRTVSDGCFAAYQCMLTITLENAQSIGEVESRTMALLFIAESKAQAGDFGSVVETIDRAIAANESRGYEAHNYLDTIEILHASIADAQTQGIYYYRRYDATIFTNNSQTRIAAKQARAGNFTSAEKTAYSIRDAFNKTLALSIVAETHAITGYATRFREIIGTAIEAANSIKIDDDRALALVIVFSTVLATLQP